MILTTLISSLRLPALSWPSTWAYSIEGARDLRLDLLRGFLVFAMVVDHIGGRSWLYGITGGNDFFVSAAEGFLFISGLVMGMVYLRLVGKHGVRHAFVKSGRRGVTLLVLNIVLTSLFLALSLWVGAWWTSPTADPLGLLFGILTLQQTSYLADIIHLYAIVLLLSPLAILALSRGLWWLVAVPSIGLWIAFQIDPSAMAVPAAGSAFPFPAWQVFFMAGLIAGWQRPWITAQVRRLGVRWIAALLALAALVLVGLYRSEGYLLLQVTDNAAITAFVDSFWNKYGVGAGRIVSAVIFFPLIYLAVTWLWAPIQRALGWFLLPLGANALYAYSLHLFIVLAVTVGIGLIPLLSADLAPVNTVVQLAGAGLLWVLIRYRVLFSVIPR